MAADDSKFNILIKESHSVKRDKPVLEQNSSIIPVRIIELILNYRNMVVNISCYSCDWCN